MASLKALARDVKNKKKPTQPKTHAKKLSASTSFKSAEIIEDDDDNKSSTEDASDDESTSSKPSATLPIANGKAEAPATIISSTERDNESESESTDESESEAEEGVVSNDASRRPTKELESVRHAGKESNIRTATFKDTPQYEPPAGFELASVNGPPKASRLFDMSSLEGKQIWYITAPASVPVASIENMSLQNAKEGKAIFSHDDSKFGIVQDTAEDKTYTKIIVPINSNTGYQISSKPLDQIFHLQHIVKLPSVWKSGTKHTGTSTAARATVPSKKFVRQQPYGLKMRFRPIGFGSGKTGNIGSSSSSAKGSSMERGSDDEEVDSPIQFRRPIVLEDDMSSTSSDSSENHEPSSNSDVKNSDARTVSSKPTTKSKSDESAIAKASERELPQDVDSSLKRKRSDDRDMKAKNKNTKKSSRKQGGPTSSVI